MEQTEPNTDVCRDGKLQTKTAETVSAKLLSPR